MPTGELIAASGTGGANWGADCQNAGYSCGTIVFAGGLRTLQVRTLQQNCNLLAHFWHMVDCELNGRCTLYLFCF